MEAMGIHPKINRWVEEFLNNRTFRIKLGDHHSSEGTVKSAVTKGYVLGRLLFLRFSYLYTVLWCDFISNTPSKQIVHTSKRTQTT